MTISITRQTRDAVEKRVLEILGEGTEVNPETFKFETPPDEKMGHLAFACFPLAKVLKKGPPIIAKEIAEAWGQSDVFAKVEAAGPYLNFFLSPAYLAKVLFEHISEEGNFGKNESGKGQTLMLEYSSPNTNKPLHLGHGRNNLLGITISRLLQYSGYELVKANLVNDRGIHICKSMLAYQNWGEGVTPEKAEKKGDHLIGDFYVLYAQKEKENPELEEQARQMLRDWEQEDPETRKLWKQMNGWVLDGFKKTYQRMGIEFDRFYYESETYEGGRELVLNALKKGICSKEDNGAVSIDLEAEKLGKKILLRGDGTTVYMTQDINTTVKKFEDYPLNGCLFVVGNEQDNHFRVLFSVLEKFGFDWASSCEHISYGMITLPEGKMKSREGTVVDLDDLMDTMRDMALEELRVRNEQGKVGRSEEELIETAEAIGQAAIKYFILRTNAQKTITFNPKESLSFDGQTGPYLQYTHARLSTLLAKAGKVETLVEPDTVDWNEDEARVLVQLSRFPDAVQESAENRNPAVLAGYVYDLARAVNKFYHDHPVLILEDEQRKISRLQLIQASKRIISQSLSILGIVPLERM